MQIANHVMRAYDARPWRFSSADYETAVEEHARSEHRLEGPVVEALWDAALAPAPAPAMQEHGLAFAEEGLSDELVRDLKR
ncbi:DUF2399 domain-containing protein [Paraburkholderia sediminicola]|uniref:DUF2399 domain-containing protein n=1 Tax=Paraburkholderia sediminicola TaxID=458836 RepID=UPI0038BD31C5